MSFTKQDAYTFLIGAAAALAFTLAQAMIETETLAEDPAIWFKNLGVGLLGALGRYLLTELTQRGFRR